MNVAHLPGRLSLTNHNPCRNNKSAAPPPAAECLLTDQIRLLVHAACAARFGAAQMTLSDWRDVEQEVKHKLDEIYATLQEGVLQLHVPKDTPYKEKEESQTIQSEEPDYEYTHR